MPAQVAKRLILVRKQLVNPLESVQLWLKRVPGTITQKFQLLELQRVEATDTNLEKQTLGSSEPSLQLLNNVVGDICTVPKANRNDLQMDWPEHALGNQALRWLPDLPIFLICISNLIQYKVGWCKLFFG